MVDFREQKPWKMDGKWMILSYPHFRKTHASGTPRQSALRGDALQSHAASVRETPHLENFGSRRQFGVSGWMFYPPNMGNSRTKYGVIPVSRIMVRWSSNCHEVLISRMSFPNMFSLFLTFQLFNDGHPWTSTILRLRQTNEQS